MLRFKKPTQLVHMCCTCMPGFAYIVKDSLIKEPSLLPRKFDVTFAYGVSNTPTHTVAAARDRHTNTATVRPNERDR